MAVGYEMTCRAGMASGASILEYGFHPTALFGGFGACAVAARLYGLDRQGLEDAWGLLLSMIGGSAQFSQDPRGTVVKRLHGGFGAKNGIMAAQLSRNGLSGPAQAFDGRFGLLNLFGQSDRLPEKLDPYDGEPLAIHRISFKPYPCCRLFHSTIDATREILGELPYADIDTIEAIHVGGPNVMPEQHMIRRPASMMAAQYSLPYSIAAALERGPYDISAFDEETLAHPVREAIADKVSCVADEAMQAAFPEHFGSWIEFRFVDGESKRVDKLDSYGTPSAPMSTADIVSKADGLLESTPLEITGAELADAVSKFVNAGSLYSLVERFKGSGYLETTAYFLLSSTSLQPVGQRNANADSIVVVLHIDQVLPVAGIELNKAFEVARQGEQPIELNAASQITVEAILPTQCQSVRVACIGGANL